MSTNKERDHFILIPEDEANNQMINGFVTELASPPCLNITICRPTGGWAKAMKLLNSTNIKYLRMYSRCKGIILVIDFDEMAGGDTDRREHIFEQILEELKDRVFILGCRSNPEELKRSLNMKSEAIGSALARQCSDNSVDNLWTTELLRHNQAEITRPSATFKPFLFPSN